MPKNETNDQSFIHDRSVLLLLTLNTFLAIALIIRSLLSLGDSDAGYIKEYRGDLGLDGFKAGNILDILAFGLFALIIYGFQVFAVWKIYPLRKEIVTMVQILTTICLLFGLLVLNELLGLL